MAGLDEKAQARLRGMLDEDGELDRLRSLVREAADADGPGERALTLRSAIVDAAALLRALRREERRCRDAATMGLMRERGADWLVEAMEGADDGD